MKKMTLNLSFKPKKLLVPFFLSAVLFAAESNAQGGAIGNDDSGNNNAGTPYSLQEAIDFALRNNIQLKQSKLSVENSLNTLEQSRWLKYPNLNGSFGLNGNLGRNIDPFSNQIVTQAITTNNMGVGANVTLYNGYRIKNTVALNELNLNADRLDLEANQNDITLNVINAYLNVLSTEDLIDVSRKQLEVSKYQIDRTQKLVEGGVLPEVNLFDLEAQLANDELQLVNAENNHESAKLTLRQVLNAPPTQDITVVRVEVPDPKMQPYAESATQVYEEAIRYLPQVKAAEARVLAANKNIELARTVGLPSITANLNWRTAYSSVAQEITSVTETFNPIAVSATVDGQTVPFVLNLPSQNFTRENIAYFNQLGNNQNTAAGINMSIPIFNSFNAKYNVQGAKIQKMQSELQVDNTLLTIRQNVDQAFISMYNAAKSYSATLTQVKALERSFEAAEVRYNAGASDFVDYNLAKTRLDQAASNLIQSKYNYVFRIKILDFYQNKPLDF
ncbi:MAG: TolC family protein [Spirosomaceae bacterium]|nr:TolC family protein [Spirosomataceae bacterium]